jgi:hypothetical protein
MELVNANGTCGQHMQSFLADDVNLT